MDVQINEIDDTHANPSDLVSLSLAGISYYNELDVYLNVYYDQLPRWTFHILYN